MEWLSSFRTPRGIIWLGTWRKLHSWRLLRAPGANDVHGVVFSGEQRTGVLWFGAEYFDWTDLLIGPPRTQSYEEVRSPLICVTLKGLTLEQVVGLANLSSHSFHTGSKFMACILIKLRRDSQIADNVHCTALAQCKTDWIKQLIHRRCKIEISRGNVY